MRKMFSATKKEEERSYRTMDEEVQYGKEKLFSLIEASDSNKIDACFDSFRLFPKDITRLALGLNNNANIRSLSLRDCQLREEDILVLKEAVLRTKSLAEIEIEKFDGYKLATKQAIDDMQMHVAQCRQKTPRMEC